MGRIAQKYRQNEFQASLLILPIFSYPIHRVKIYRMDRMGKKDGEDSIEV